MEALKAVALTGGSDGVFISDCIKFIVLSVRKNVRVSGGELKAS